MRLNKCINLVVGFTLLDDDNMTKIFQTIVDWKFGVDGYPTAVAQMNKKIVLATPFLRKEKLFSTSYTIFQKIMHEKRG